jgi:hypothetical protein
MGTQTASEKSSVFVNRFTRALSSGRAAEVLCSMWFPGSVSTVAPARMSSASPTGFA